MKFLPLILRNLLRRKVRTIFTILSIVVAFVLFGVLMAIRAAFSMGVDIAGADRLMVIHKMSFIMPLPQGHAAKIRVLPGVTDVDAYINPLPHALMLTAIVVGVSTTGVALALLIRIYRYYGTLEEPELLERMQE